MSMPDRAREHVATMGLRSQVCDGGGARCMSVQGG